MSRLGLLYHAGALGDFVLSLPAVHRVVRAFGGRRWLYWGPEDRLVLLPCFGRAPSEFERFGHTLWGEGADPRVLGALGEDCVVLAFGGRVPPPWAGLFPGRSLPVASFPTSGGLWVPAHQARQLDGLGVPRLREPWLPPWRAAVLGERRPEEILLHPGSGDRRKNLPPQTWATAAETVGERAGLPLRVLLGPVEIDRGDWVGNGAVTPCEDLGDLLRALGRAALFLGNDSGPTHLAAVLGIPTVAAFGPSDPALWRPLGARAAVVRAGLPCSPCTDGGPIRCAEASCLESLPSECIVAAALAVLTRGDGARPCPLPRRPRDRR